MESLRSALGWVRVPTVGQDKVKVQVGRDRPLEPRRNETLANLASTWMERVSKTGVKMLLKGTSVPSTSQLIYVEFHVVTCLSKDAQNMAIDITKLSAKLNCVIIT